MPPHIDSYSFGKITIDGEAYSRDVIVRPDGVTPDWWRRDGHNLVPEDLADALEQTPEVLVVGCGAHGVLKVPDRTREWLASKGIELVELTTPEACDRYNEFAPAKKVVAGLHLTC